MFLQLWLSGHNNKSFYIFLSPEILWKKGVKKAYNFAAIRQ